jgi:CHAD domain-containing protein
MLSAIVRSQRGKINRKVIESLSSKANERRNLLLTIALFRIGLSLDESNSQSSTIEVQKMDANLMVIEVDGPHAEVDAKAANIESKFWQDVMNNHMLFQHAGKNRGEKAQQILKYSFPKPMKNAGVEPWDPMAEAGRKVLKYFFAEMLAHEQGTMLGEDIEELHDMRVATRRMRSAFDVFSEYYNSKSIRKYLRGLKNTGRALGPVRDLDVFMEKAERFIKEGPPERREGLAPLLDTWLTERETARGKMIDYLNSDDYNQFRSEFNVFLNTPGMGIRDPQDGSDQLSLVQHAAPILIYTQLASVRNYDATINNATIEQMHALRIEFKKFRYTVEFFKEVLGEEYSHLIADIKIMQDHLGDLNDADVACQILGDFISKWEVQQMTLPLSERKNPEPIVGYLAAQHAERHNLMTTFPEVWRHFNRTEFRKNLALAISVL